MSNKALALTMFICGIITMIIIGSFLYMVNMDATLFSGIVLACLFTGGVGYCVGMKHERRTKRQG